MARQLKQRARKSDANDDDEDDMQRKYKNKKRAVGFSGGQPKSTGKPTVSKLDNKVRFGPLKTNNLAVNPMMRLKKAMRKISRK